MYVSATYTAAGLTKPYSSGRYLDMNNLNMLWLLDHKEKNLRATGDSGWQLDDCTEQLMTPNGLGSTF